MTLSQPKGATGHYSFNTVKHLYIHGYVMQLHTVIDQSFLNYIRVKTENSEGIHLSSKVHKNNFSNTGSWKTKKFGEKLHNLRGQQTCFGKVWQTKLFAGLAGHLIGQGHLKGFSTFHLDRV
jgi:hypothetical protein